MISHAEIKVARLPPTYRRARLLESVHGHGFGDMIIFVPKGFETDFTSIPRLLWPVLPPWDRYTPAAIIHDWLYAKNGVTRRVADRLFLHHMKALGVPWWQRMAIYSGVRLGGWVAWNRYRKAEANSSGGNQHGGID